MTSLKLIEQLLLKKEINMTERLRHAVSELLHQHFPEVRRLTFFKMVSVEALEPHKFLISLNSSLIPEPSSQEIYKCYVTTDGIHHNLELYTGKNFLSEALTNISRIGASYE